MNKYIHVYIIYISEHTHILLCLIGKLFIVMYEVRVWWILWVGGSGDEGKGGLDYLLNDFEASLECG